MSKHTRTPHEIADPIVVVDVRSGDMYATFCETGVRVFYCETTEGLMCCTSACCLCSTDSYGPFRYATEDETADFWLTMDGLAAEASCKY